MMMMMMIKSIEEEEQQEKVSSPSKVDEKNEQDSFQGWFVLTVSSALVVVVVVCGSLVVVEKAGTTGGFLCGAALVATLLAAAGTCVSLSKNAFLMRLFAWFIPPIWLVVLLAYENLMMHHDKAGTTCFLFGWISFGISLHNLLLQILNQENQQQRAQEDWCKFALTTVLSGYYGFCWYKDWISVLASCATLIWIVYMVLYRQQCLPNQPFPWWLSLVWLSLAIFWCNVMNFATWIELTVLAVRAANAYYATRLANLVPAMQEWTLRRQTRFIVWSAMTGASGVAVSGIVPIMVSSRSNGKNDDDDDDDNRRPASFICLVSLAMVCFLLIHGFIAMQFYWQHDKSSIFFENRLVRREKSQVVCFAFIEMTRECETFCPLDECVGACVFVLMVLV